MADPTGNGWNEWKLFVRNALMDFGSFETFAREKLTDIQIDIAKLKTKLAAQSGLIALVVSLVIGIVFTLINFNMDK